LRSVDNQIQSVEGVHAPQAFEEPSVLIAKENKWVVG
jgi:hypothetical protein